MHARKCHENDRQKSELISFPPHLTKGKKKKTFQSQLTIPLHPGQKCFLKKKCISHKTEQ
jgi:hypothetical protein